MGKVPEIKGFVLSTVNSAFYNFCTIFILASLLETVGVNGVVPNNLA